MRLTKKAVEAARPKDRDQWLWDGEIKGFALRVKPTGVKSFMVQYRNATGRTRKVTLGKFGVLTVEQARDQARQMLAAVAAGADPAEQRKQERNLETVKDLWERYLSAYAEAHKKHSSVQNDRYMWNQDVEPALGKKRVDGVTKQDIQRIHASLKDRPYWANRVLSLLSKMFGLAEEWGIRPELSNPCRTVKRYREAKRERYLSGDEYKALWEALAEAEASETEPQAAIDAIRLLILTGCRRDEILKLQWREVDTNRRVLRLQDSKTGQREVILSQAAVDTLRGILQRPVVDAVHVCPGRKPGQPYVGLRRVWTRICKAAGIGETRIHDLRHGFASVLAGSGHSLPIIGKALGHTRSETTARYAHLQDDPVRTAVDLAGNIIMAAVKKTG